MKKRMICLLLVLTLLLTGCANAGTQAHAKTREFTDSLGRTVTVPEKITKIAISFWYFHLSVMLSYTVAYII